MRRRSSARSSSAWFPADAVLTPRHEVMPAWDSLNENSKRLFAHQMEVYAGYSENADHHVGRLLDSIEEMGELDDTLVVWIWGDNGASLEGTPTGTFNEGTMVNGLPLTDEEQMQLALKWGGVEAWGTEMMYPHYSTAWAWAGNTPVCVGQAGRLASRRHAQPAGRPLAHSVITDTGGLRSQFTHVTDIGPTILDMCGIPQPTHVDGVEQQPMTGISFADVARATPTRPTHHTQQYFENFGNRAMYKDGWWLAMRMPRDPVAAGPGDAQEVRARCVETGRRSGRALLPARRLLPGERPVSEPPRRRSKSCRTCSGKRPRSTTSSRCSPGSRRSSGSCRRSARKRPSPTTGMCRTSPPGRSRGSTTTPTRSARTSTSPTAVPKA